MGALDAAELSTEMSSSSKPADEESMAVVPSKRRGQHRRSSGANASSMALLLRKLPSMSEIVAQAASPKPPPPTMSDQSIAEVAAELRGSNPHGMIQIQLVKLEAMGGDDQQQLLRMPMSCRVEVAGLVAESCYAKAEEEAEGGSTRWGWQQWLWFSAPRVVDPAELVLRFKILTGDPAPEPDAPAPAAASAADGERSGGEVVGIVEVALNSLLRTSRRRYV